MKTLRRSVACVPFVLLPLLAACGDQLVEFPADGGSTDSHTVDVATHDSASRDSGADADEADAVAGDAVAIDTGDHDSGRGDAATPDSGVPDAPTEDSAHPDANVGPVDAGTPDVALLDARSEDAETFDTGTHDATVHDAGALDSGEHDSGDATTHDAGAVDAPEHEAGALDATTDAKVVDSGKDANDASEGMVPKVVSTVPLTGATGVSIAQTLSATFSEAMNPTTITALTFTLEKGTTSVPGTVSYVAAGTEATFVPTTQLAVGAMYTATITLGAKSAGGTPLANAYTWSFTTSACGQLPVELNSASTFAVLAGSTVTNSGPTSVTGNMGVSPGTALTGFPPGTVTSGAIQSGNPAAAQAQLDLTTAYNDAAGRTLCPVSVAGNLGGQTLAPGLYKSTSSLAVSSGNLTLDAQGDPNAVFIFQMASTLTVTAGLQVILSGGASANNVFWQVGTSATLGTTSVFEGTILANQAISIDTGATLNGRALASIAAVSMLSDTVVDPTP